MLHDDPHVFILVQAPSSGPAPSAPSAPCRPGVGNEVGAPPRPQVEQAPPRPRFLVNRELWPLTSLILPVFPLRLCCGTETGLQKEKQIPGVL